MAEREARQISFRVPRLPTLQKRTLAVTGAVLVAVLGAGAVVANATGGDGATMAQTKILCGKSTTTDTIQSENPDGDFIKAMGAAMLRDADANPKANPFVSDAARKVGRAWLAVPDPDGASSIGYLTATVDWLGDVSTALGVFEAACAQAGTPRPGTGDKAVGDGDGKST